MFTARLQWHALAALLAHFGERVSFGAQSELLPLLQIPHVQSFRARALFAAGLRSVEDVAGAPLEDVTGALAACSALRAPAVEVWRRTRDGTDDGFCTTP
eukprot:1044833_1